MNSLSCFVCQSARWNFVGVGGNNPPSLQGCFFGAVQNSQKHEFGIYFLYWSSPNNFHRTQVRSSPCLVTKSLKLVLFELFALSKLLQGFVKIDAWTFSTWDLVGHSILMPELRLWWPLPSQGILGVKWKMWPPETLLWTRLNILGRQPSDHKLRKKVKVFLCILSIVFIIIFSSWQGLWAKVHDRYACFL